MERARIINEPPDPPEATPPEPGITRAIIYRPESTRRKILVNAFELYQLAAIGCTIVEAAEFFCCSRDHIMRILDEQEEMNEAWNRGKAQSKISLRHLQFQHAKRADASGVAMTIHMSKHRLGEQDKVINALANHNNEPLKITFNFDSPAERAKNAGISD